MQAGNRRNRTSKSGKSWFISLGITAGMIAVGLAVVAFQYTRKRSSEPDAKPVETKSTESSTAASSLGSQRPADLSWTYPRIPADVRVPPEWLMADTTFDLKTLFAPIPPEENAAQLYLDALLDFSGELVCCFPEKDQEARRTATRQRLTVFEPQYELWKGGNRVDPATFDKAVAAFQKGFDKLAKAQERSRCVFETGITLTALLPHVQAVRSVAKVVQAQSARDLERGDSRRPIQSLDILLRLSRDLRTRAWTVSAIAGAAIDTIALATVRDILRAPAITKESIDQLRTVLIRHEQASSIHPLAEVCPMEYVMCRMTLHELEQRTGVFGPDGAKSFGISDASPGAVLSRVTGGGIVPRQLDAQIALLTSDDYRKLALAVSDRYKRLDEISRRPYRERATALEEWQADAKKQFLLAALVSGLGTADLALTRAQATRRAAICLLALRRWELDNTVPPPDLAAVLKAAGIDAVPMDPFSGEPLKLAFIGGETVVYSIGRDGRDDKAQRDWNNGNQDGDFIFRISDKSR